MHDVDDDDIIHFLELSLLFCHTHVVLMWLEHCENSWASSSRYFTTFPYVSVDISFAHCVKEVLMETWRGSSTWISSHYLERGHSLVQDEA